MSHTPGPWRIGLCGSIVSNCQTDCDQNKDNEKFYGGHFICESVTGANARLIAAAPELLEACKGIASLDDGDLAFVWKFPDQFKRLHAAIAKAEGGETRQMTEGQSS